MGGNFDMEKETAGSGDAKEMEERALSVFSSERNEDLTALIFCLITTFLVLLFTKWMV
jgi:hypothetical protein